MLYARLSVISFTLATLSSAAGGVQAQTPSPLSNNIYEAASGRYNAGLAAQCLAKHLEWIAPGEMPDHNDEFEATLDPDTQSRINLAAVTLPGGGNARCPGVGASCGNTTRIAAYDRIGLLPRFIGFICALPERCTEQSTCQPAAPSAP